MIAAVLDTNVLVSGFVGHPSTSIPAQLIDGWRARTYTLVVSEHILAEFARTLEEPYFRRQLAPEQAAANVTLLRRQALLTDLTVEVSGVATHPEDDLVLATAVSAGADYLVTGDRKLQCLSNYEGIRIVSPRAFLEDVLQAG